LEFDMSKRNMHLVTHLCTGPTNHHNGGWRHPLSDGDKVLDPARYEELVRISERGLFDGVFIVDYQWQQDLKEGHPSLIAKHGGQMAMLDPIQILAVMARVTKHIGLTATLSTSFYHAYHIARAFGTLDHLSNGRAGWNIVTSGTDAEAQNYGLDQLKERGSRYDHADQVVEACLALWHTWEADALKLDRESGIFADAEKIHYVNYSGSLVRTRGGLTTPRPPQGHPVLMQAGASPRGREFAARWAEVIFTLQQEKSLMQNFYADMKDRIGKRDRNPDHCVVLPSIDVIVGDTEAIAREQADYLDTFANLEMGLKTFSGLYGRDLSQYPLDTPIPDIPIDRERLGTIGAYDNLLATRKDGRAMTLGEAALLQATTWLCPRLVGTPAMVVDQMQDMFESRCCDGFILATSLSPVGLRMFVEKVVPELQRRGLYRTKYTGATFRDNLRS
jgi:FMN-dependent oxidoreductase (nitrilotriacetate monooxygenase family)